MTNNSYVITAAALSASHVPVDSSTMRADFFLDSGATTHVVGDPALLHDFVPQRAVLNGVGGTAEVSGHGRLVLDVTDEDGTVLCLAFEHTLCALGAPNLLSLSRFAQGGATCSLSDSAVITVGGHRLRAMGESGLYVLSATILAPSPSVLVSSTTTSTESPPPLDHQGLLVHCLLLTHRFFRHPQAWDQVLLG